jgi:AraC-like DNA-binding protein
MRRTREEIHQLVQHERKLKNRLQLATTRLEEAERERIWAIVAAHDAGLSIRKIAAATGLSRSRIHQLLQEQEAHEIPEWLTHLRDREANPETLSDTDQRAPDTLIRAHIFRLISPCPAVRDSKDPRPPLARAPGPPSRKE